MVLADIHEPSIYYKEASVNKKSARFCLKQLSIGEETKKKERKSTDSVNIQVVKGKILKSVFSENTDHFFFGLTCLIFFGFSLK